MLVLNDLMVLLQGKQAEELAGMEKIGQLFTNLTAAGTTIGIAVATFFYLVAGFLYMTAAGSSRQMENAKMAAITATIGLVIVLGAQVISSVIEGAIGPATPKTPGGGGV